jgi:hypothetical protein
MPLCRHRGFRVSRGGQLIHHPPMALRCGVLMPAVEGLPVGYAGAWGGYAGAWGDVRAGGHGGAEERQQAGQYVVEFPADRSDSWGRWVTLGSGQVVDEGVVAVTLVRWR